MSLFTFAEITLVANGTTMAKRCAMVVVVALLLTSSISDARLTGRALQEVQECSDDSRLCPDGSRMGRNPANNCRFYTCSPIIKVLPGDPKIWVAPIPDKGDDKKCRQEARLCADGSVIAPDPDNACSFPECPPCCDKKQVREVCIFGEPECCEDGTWTCLKGGKYRCGDVETTNPNGKVCSEEQKEEDVVVSQPSCIVETKTCPDGSIVAPDPDNGCELPPCPEVTCCEKSDSLPCNDGREAACCDDGTWACPTVDDGIVLYLCSRKVYLDRPSGTICATQDPPTTTVAVDEKTAITTTREPITTQEPETTTQEVATTSGPPTCPDDLQSCSDGSQVGRDLDNNCEFFSCPNSSEPCCDPNSSHSCLVGARKCCNGQWICSFNPQGTFYRCDGVTPNPAGLVCSDQDIAPGSPSKTMDPTTQDTTAIQEAPATTLEAQDASTTQAPPFETTAVGVKGAPGEKEPKECPPDQRRCPDGSVVGCDPNKNCEFYPCKKSAVKKTRVKRRKQARNRRKRRRGRVPKRAAVTKEERADKRRTRRQRVREKLIFLNSGL